MLGASIVVVFGSTALNDAREGASLLGAEETMSQFDSQASLVAHGSVKHRQVSLPTQQDGPGGATVDPDAGRLRITISGKTNMTRTITLGTVRYRQGQTTIAYQGGGVWRLRDNGSTMVSPPEFEYHTQSGGQPTLTLPLVLIRGSGSGEQVIIRQAGATQAIVPNNTVQNPLRDSEVNITVSSRYYKAWGRYFEERTSGDVTYDHATNNVTIQLVAPSGGATISNAIVSDGGTLTVESGAFVDSYDSSVGPYDAGPNFKGRVASGATYDMSSGAEIQGTLNVDGTTTFESSNIIIHRAVYINGTSGTSSVDNAEAFKRDVHVGGDLDATSTHDLFKQDLYVGGDLDELKTGVDGELHVGGNAKLNKKADLNDDVVVGGDVTAKTKHNTIGGTLHAGGDVTLSNDADVKTVVASGNVTVKGKSTTADIYAGGTVEITDQNAEINGDVRAGNTIKFSGGGDINGNATANNDIILNDGGATITGDATAGDNVDEGSGTIQGSITEGASLGSVRDPRSPQDPTPATVPSYNPATDEINEKEAALTGSNDNDATANISGNTLTSCNDGCTIPAGDYYLDKMKPGGSSSVTFNTTNGDIEIYVENDINWKGSVSIVGDGQVKIYGNGDFKVKGDVTNPDHRADQLWVYLKPGRSADVTSNSQYIGVIFGPGTPSNNLDVNIGSKGEVFGAVVGQVDADSNSEIHYDLALRSSQAFATATTTPKVTYLHISQTKVKVE